MAKYEKSILEDKIIENDSRQIALEIESIIAQNITSEFEISPDGIISFDESIDNSNNTVCQFIIDQFLKNKNK